MADWGKPTLTSTYVNFVVELDNRLDDVATQFPSTGSFTNLPIGTISFRNNKWQTWNGSAWADTAASYAINISGTASNITGTLSVANGGTNITSYTVGDLLYASGATTLTRLAAVAAGSVLKSNGVGAPPSWGSVSLTDNTTGILPVTKGGTGVTTISGLIKGNGTSVFSAAIPGVDYADAQHTHNYLPLTGGTISGNLSIISGTAERTLTIGSSGGYWYGNTDATGFFKTGGANFTIDTNSGNLFTNGNVTAYSDVRLKTNINTITAALDKVNQLRGVSYTKDSTPGIGLIAQEVEKVLPELVFTGKDGYKSVAYQNIVALLIEAVKELTTKLEAR